jgi:hypothetical protein
MRFRFAALLGACVALAPLGFASADTAPNYPKPPKPDFTSVKFLVGTWACSSKSSRRPAAVLSTETYALDSTGYYLVQTTTSKGSPWFPYASVTTDMITYDSQIKQWADVTTGSLGAYGLSMSPGWSDGKWVWHPVNNTPYFDVASFTDYTITKVSDTKWTAISGFKTKAGKSVSVADTCTKSS